MGSKDSSVPGRLGLLRLARQGHGILAPSTTRNNQRVPELPDLRILAEAFTSALGGRALSAWQVAQPLVLRGTSSELDGLVGQHLDSVEQRGKFLTFRFSRDRIVINAMLTGRLGLAAPGTKPFPQTAMTFTFSGRLERPKDVAAWTKDAPWLPPDGDPIELRYRDPKRMGKVYVVPDGVERAIAGWDELGPDADDPALDLAAWRSRIARHTGELMSLLKNQAFVAGIGNGYSDEVLWAARLAPFRKRSSLADEEVERLWRATPQVMRWAIDELHERVPPRFEVEQRGFLNVHRKGGQPCPRCGTTLSEVSPGGFVTTWCRGCQV
jgi:formamidopyrimidine-DNA glycosylase